MKSTWFFRGLCATSLASFFLVGGLPSLASAPTMNITIESGSPYYLPVTATVSAGTPVRWDNPTPSPHTVTHMGCVEGAGPCWFDSGPIGPDSTFTVPTLPPGRYPYYCQLHPIMRGLLIVTDPTGGTSAL